MRSRWSQQMTRARANVEREGGPYLWEVYGDGQYTERAGRAKSVRGPWRGKARPGRCFLSPHRTRTTCRRARRTPHSSALTESPWDRSFARFVMTHIWSLSGRAPPARAKLLLVENRRYTTMRGCPSRSARGWLRARLYKVRTSTAERTS